MKSIFGCVVVLYLVTGIYAQQPKTESGTYSTYVGDQLFGTEDYSLTNDADGAVKSEAEISFATTKFHATTVMAKNRPLSFLIEMGGARTLV